MIDIDITLTLPNYHISANFTAGKGVCALFGPSGSGKSTIIKAIGGLIKPDQGLIRINDRILFDSHCHIDIPARERQLGHVFQENRLFPHFTVRGNLTYAMRFGRANNVVSKVDEVIDLLGLHSLMHRWPATLSGGERQRVAIGRALLSNPMALLMDEPLASLDAEMKADILPYLDRLCREAGILILYVSHARDEVARLAETVVSLARGKVCAVGPVNKILARSDNEQDIPGTVLYGKVAYHDDQHRLTCLTLAEQNLFIPRIHQDIATNVRIYVSADDVALALINSDRMNIHSIISIRNHLSGKVASIQQSDDMQADIGIAIGEQFIMARITTWALADLNLKKGQPIIALLKTIALKESAIVVNESYV